MERLLTARHDRTSLENNSSVLFKKYASDTMKPTVATTRWKPPSSADR
jgi:hypothetical protein